MRTFVNVHGGISYPDCGRKVVGFFYSGCLAKKNPENCASDCTDYFLFSKKRIFEKAFLETKLLILKACFSADTKLPQFQQAF